MAGFNLGRVFSYVVNEFVVNGLANNPTFQRFAVRTSRKFDDISKFAAKKTEEVAGQVKEGMKNRDSFNR